MDLGGGHRPSLGNVTNDTRPAPSLPPAWNSMLRTTTESGETGQFASKPSRVPQTSGAHQSIRSTYNDTIAQQVRRGLHRPVVTDDRRRLPSYTRDTTSEIISMYENSGHKSPGRPHLLRSPGDRSYSMTQSNVSPRGLLNHQSYASLRSQPDLSLMPRSQSSLAFSGRTRYNGLRAPSPALTNQDAGSNGQRYIPWQQPNVSSS
jgi:hypothetical protein